MNHSIQTAMKWLLIVSVLLLGGAAYADTTPPTGSIIAPSEGAMVSGRTTITASANDSLSLKGNGQQSGVHRNIDDLIDPFVDVVSPLNGSVFTVGDNIQIIAEPTDPQGDDTIVKVVFWVNCCTRIDTAYSYPWVGNWTPTEAGQYYLYAQVWDEDGNDRYTLPKDWVFIVVFDAVSTINKLNKQLPLTFSLGQNNPNPFNPTTEISFSLPQASHAKLEIYNIKGQKMATLVNRHMEAGYHTVSFDGGKLASGIYLYRLQADDFVETKKMMLVK